MMNMDDKVITIREYRWKYAAIVLFTLVFVPFASILKAFFNTGDIAGSGLWVVFLFVKVGLYIACAVVGYKFARLFYSTGISLLLGVLSYFVLVSLIPLAFLVIKGNSFIKKAQTEISQECSSQEGEVSSSGTYSNNEAVNETKAHDTVWLSRRGEENTQQEQEGIKPTPKRESAKIKRAFVFLWRNVSMKMIIGSILVAVSVYLSLLSYTPGHVVRFGDFSHYTKPEVKPITIIPGVFLLIVGGVILIKGISEYFRRPPSDRNNQTHGEKE